MTTSNSCQKIYNVVQLSNKRLKYLKLIKTIEGFAMRVSELITREGLEVTKESLAVGNKIIHYARSFGAVTKEKLAMDVSESIMR